MMPNSPSWVSTPTDLGILGKVVWVPVLYVFWWLGIIVAGVTWVVCMVWDNLTMTEQDAGVVAAKSKRIAQGHHDWHTCPECGHETPSFFLDDPLTGAAFGVIYCKCGVALRLSGGSWKANEQVQGQE